ncbi:MAG: Mth938-like domain-containing protein [Betaproteobacteria bacterium]|jgi:Uncharacterized conserved protein|nr:Mth938-like domain-containing protein [Betaproteobacteria bacterium]
MKLVQHHDNSRYTLTGHGPGFVMINDLRWTSPLILSPSRLQTDWVVGFSDLTSQHFADILAFDPELVLFGSGTLFRFPDIPLTRTLIENRIGLEVMDTAAACRTYTVLASEGRRVVAALIIEPITAT